MGSLTLTLVLGGRRIESWTALEFRSSLQEMVDEVEVAMPASVGVGFVGQEAATLHVNGHLVFTGWIVSVSTQVASDSGTTTIRCLSATVDLVDSSVDLDDNPAELHNVDLFSVVLQYVHPWVRISMQAENLPGIIKVAVQPGETIHELIDRYARQAGIFLRSTEKGALLVERVGTGLSEGSLTAGDNVAEYQVNVDVGQLFHQTKVIGQSQTEEGFGGDGATGASASSTDESVRSSRITVVQAAGPASPDECAVQAEWQAAVAAAQSAKVTCAVTGWLAKKGIWKPNQIVPVSLGQIGFHSRMLVNAVTLSASSDSGYTGSIELVSPDSYVPNPVRAAAENVTRERLKESGWADWQERNR